MLYLYALIAPLDGLPEAVRGIDKAPLWMVEAGGLSAVVSTLPPGEVLPTPRRLWQHEQVVEALMTQAAVVPLRFATLMPDEAAVAQCLAERKAGIVQDLERVQGCVELSLRVVRMALPPSPRVAGDGLPCPDLLASEKNGRTFEIAYRAARLQRDALRRREESVGEMINRSLCEHAVDHVYQVQPGAGAIVRASYLVEASRLRAIKNTVYRLMAAHRHLHFLCTGPWPPYHFVHGLEPAAAAA